MLPWSSVAILIATIAVAAGMAQWAFGPPVVPLAVAGAVAGIAGTLMGSTRRAGLAILCTLAAFVIGEVGPGWVIALLVIPGLSALVGIEASRFGSRAFVFALFGWISLDAQAHLAGTAEAIGAFVLAALIGIAVAKAKGLEGRMVAPPASDLYGISMAVGLWIGLLLALMIGQHLDPVHAHWIAVMLAMRALARPGSHRAKALTFGVGSVLGAGLAGLVLTLPLPLLFVHGVGIVFLVLGIRWLPAQRLQGPGLISAGIVLATAATIGTALFRAEAAAMAALYVLGYSWLSGMILQRIEPADGQVAAAGQDIAHPAARDLSSSDPDRETR